MSAIFPTAVATTLQMLQAINNTKVTLNVNAGIGDTTLTVDDSSPLPTSGYVTFDDNEASPETVQYTGKSGNNLTGVTRAADSTAAGTHIAGAHLEMRWNAAYHNTLATEIIAVEQNLSDRIGVDAGSHYLTIVDGAVATPSLTFAADLDTGIYRIGANDLAIATGGTKALEVNGSQQVVIPKTSSQIIIGTTNTITISSTAPASSRVYTLPDAGGSATFILSTGGTTLSLSTSLTVTGVTNQIILGTTNTITINAAAPASSRVYTIPDAGGAANFALANSLTATTVPYLDANKLLTSSAVTPTELGYVSGVTSAIQTQLSGVPAPNILDNGGFEIWQRGATFTNPASAAYTADRWKTNTNTAASAIVTQEATTIDNGVNSMKVVISGSPVAKFWYVQQGIENYKSYASKVITVSVRVKSSVASTIRIGLYDGVTNPLSSYHTGGGGWETLSATITVSATPSELTVQLGMLASSDAINGSYFFDSAMLVVSASAPTYSPTNPATDLVRCQRFYQRFGGNSLEVVATGQCYTTTQTYCLLKFLVSMRAAPTVTASAPTHFGIWNAAASVIACTAINPDASSATKWSIAIGAIVASGLVAGNATTLTVASGQTDAIIECTADL